MMFDLIFNLFPLFFLLVLGLMIWIVVQNIRTSRRNDRSPKLEEIGRASCRERV